MPDRIDLQAVVLDSPRGRVVAVDSAYDTRPTNRGRDVVVNASYCGVLPARFIGQHAPKGAIGMDCAIGPEAAGIAGLWYLEALEIPAATADVMTAELGNGTDLFHSGVISRINAPAAQCGASPGMLVRDVARLMLEHDAAHIDPSEITNRTVVYSDPERGHIVCTDSIAFGLPEDQGRNVLCTAGHTGRSSVEYLTRFSPRGFICSDGGRGKNDSGIAGLAIVEEHGLAGATVDARTARMGDGRSTYTDGVISACNAPALGRGVFLGQPAREAALALLLG